MARANASEVMGKIGEGLICFIYTLTLCASREPCVPELRCGFPADARFGLSFCAFESQNMEDDTPNRAQSSP